MKKFFWNIHRWAGLFLAPFFAVVLITGLILAFKPILAPTYSNTPLGDRAEQFFATVQTLEEQGVEISAIAVDQNKPIVWVASGRQNPLKAYDLADGHFVQTGGLSNQVYNFAKKLHKTLLVSPVVGQILSLVMLAMILVGLIFMIRPHFEKKLMSWHNALGVIALPLWVLLPLTGFLMTMHIGAPKMKLIDTPKAGEIISILHERNELPNLVSIEQARKWTTVNMLVDGKVQKVQVDEDGIYPVHSKVYLPKVLHEGTWSGSLSGSLNLIIDAVLLFFLLSGVYAWAMRQIKNKKAQALIAQNPHDKNTILVAFGSQTGNAEKLAHQTVQYLQKQNRAAQAFPLSVISANQLDSYQQLLLICSTTGDGELPENARNFVQSLEKADLKNVHYRLLALGDSHFAHFVAGGKTLNQALQKAGAIADAPMQTADGEPTAAWQTWLNDFALQEKLTPIATAESVQDISVDATLIRKQRLDNPQYPVRELWELVFRLPEKVDFQSGDLLLITPPNDSFPRSYSIGSNSFDGREVRLTVGLHTTTNEQGQKQEGRCSSWLLHELQTGSTISAVLRSHPAFHLTDDSRPVIMAAVGSGIAPLIGFISPLNQKRRPAWLFYGNAHRDGDFAYGDIWQKALSDGVLTHVSALFDNENRGFVQDEMMRQSEELYRWIVQENAVIYVCGRVKTIGNGIEKALRNILQTQGKMNDEQVQSYIAQMKAEGRLNMDLFG